MMLFPVENVNVSFAKTTESCWNWAGFMGIYRNNEKGKSLGKIPKYMLEMNKSLLLGFYLALFLKTRPPLVNHTASRFVLRG